MRPVLCYGEDRRFFKTSQSLDRITTLTYVIMDIFLSLFLLLNAIIIFANLEYTRFRDYLILECNTRLRFQLIGMKTSQIVHCYFVYMVNCTLYRLVRWTKNITNCTHLFCLYGWLYTIQFSMINKKTSQIVHIYFVYLVNCTLYSLVRLTRKNHKLYTFRWFSSTYFYFWSRFLLIHSPFLPPSFFRREEKRGKE